MQFRKLLTCLLLLSAALTVILIPEASSQQFTTSTAILTSTLIQTLTSNSASQINFTSTTVEMITDSNNPYWAIGPTCYYADVVSAFQVLGPEFSVHVTYSASEPVILHILSLNTWRSDVYGNLTAAAATCNPEGSVYHTVPSSSGSFDVSGLSPSDGPFYIWAVVNNEINSPTAFTISYLSVEYSRSTATTYVTALLETSVTILVSSLQTIEATASPVSSNAATTTA